MTLLGFVFCGRVASLGAFGCIPQQCACAKEGDVCGRCCGARCMLALRSHCVSDEMPAATVPGCGALISWQSPMGVKLLIVGTWLMQAMMGCSFECRASYLI